VVLSGFQDQLATLKSRLFPRRVYVQLADQALSLMVLAGRQIEWFERVPLPEGLCVNGEPRATEALGDFLGDLLVERGYPGARLKAVLPRAAIAWRVIEWPDGAWPDQPELVVRQKQDELDLPWSLQDVDLWLEPLTDAPPRSLLVAAPRAVLEAWIAVCNQAGVALDGIEAEPLCLWRAVKPQLPPCGGLQVLLQLEAERSWLLALDQGQPLGEWCLPPVADEASLAQALGRWRQRFIPRAGIVIPADDRSLEPLLPLLRSWLGCQLRGVAHREGEASLWGLVEAEQQP
jgi:hypothetical protein